MAAEEAEAIRGPGKVRKRIRVLVKGPPICKCKPSRTCNLEMLELSAKDAESLIKQGWKELPEDKLPGYEDGYTEEQTNRGIPNLNTLSGQWIV